MFNLIAWSFYSGMTLYLERIIIEEIYYIIYAV